MNTLRMSPRHAEKDIKQQYPVTCWLVEVSHASWLNCFRKSVWRFEKPTRSHLGRLMLAAPGTAVGKAVIEDKPNKTYGYALKDKSK